MSNSNVPIGLEETMHESGLEMIKMGLVVEDMVPHLREDMINIGVLIYEQDWRKEIQNFDECIEGLMGHFEEQFPGFTERMLKTTKLTKEEYGYMLLGFFSIGQTTAMIYTIFSDIEAKMTKDHS